MTITFMQHTWIPYFYNSRHSPGAVTPSGAESSYKAFISEMAPHSLTRKRSESLDHIVTLEKLPTGKINNSS